MAQKFIATERIDPDETERNLQHRKRKQAEPALGRLRDSNQYLATEAIDADQVPVDLERRAAGRSWNPRQELPARAAHFVLNNRFVGHGVASGRAAAFERP